MGDTSDRRSRCMVARARGGRNLPASTLPLGPGPRRARRAWRCVTEQHQWNFRPARNSGPSMQWHARAVAALAGKAALRSGVGALGSFARAVVCRLPAIRARARAACGAVCICMLAPICALSILQSSHEHACTSPTTPPSRIRAQRMYHAYTCTWACVVGGGRLASGMCAESGAMHSFQDAL